MYSHQSYFLRTIPKFSGAWKCSTTRTDLSHDVGSQSATKPLKSQPNDRFVKVKILAAVYTVTTTDEKKFKTIYTPALSTAKISFSAGEFA